MRNKWCDNRRKLVHVPVPATDAPLPDQAGPEEDVLEEAEYRNYLVGRALQLM